MGTVAKALRRVRLSCAVVLVEGVGCKEDCVEGTVEAPEVGAGVVNEG